MLRIPAPSPRGTNYSGMFLSLTNDGRIVATRRPGSLLAMDEGLEAETPARRGDVIKLLKMLARMAPADWAQFQQELLDESAEDNNLLERETSPLDEQATDEPTPFKGRPRPGGAMDRRLAHDQASTKSRARFSEYMPEAARIAPAGVGYGIKADFGTAARTSKSFDAMFPDATRIKI